MAVNKSLAKKVSCFLLTGVACLFFFTASAQGGDTAKVKKEHPPMSTPAKAMLYSAICPGLGQIHNKSYWKLPIIYVGLGVAAYFIVTNQQNFNNYNNALTIRTNGGMDKYYNVYSSSELSDIIEYYHRNRDLSVIIAVGIYLLNIVDANVDAQLRSFNVSDDLSLKFTPNLLSNPMSGTMVFEPGFTLVKKL